MNENLHRLYISNKERNIIEVKRIYEIAKKNNIDVGKNFVDNYNPDIYASKYLHQIITKNEENKNLIDEESWKIVMCFIENLCLILLHYFCKYR